MPARCNIGRQSFESIRGTIGLDAGRVEEVAEVTVNGKHMGAKIHPPYVWDISSAVHTGSNEIIIDVTNPALARWKMDFRTAMLPAG